MSTPSRAGPLRPLTDLLLLVCLACLPLGCGRHETPVSADLLARVDALYESITDYAVRTAGGLGVPHGTDVSISTALAQLSSDLRLNERATLEERELGALIDSYWVVAHQCAMLRRNQFWDQFRSCKGTLEEAADAARQRIDHWKRQRSSTNPD